MSFSICPIASWVLSGEDQEAPEGKPVEGEQVSLTQEPGSLTSVSHMRRLLHKAVPCNTMTCARRWSPRLVPETASLAFSDTIRKNLGGGWLGDPSDCHCTRRPALTAPAFVSALVILPHCTNCAGLITGKQLREITLPRCPCSMD